MKRTWIWWLAGAALALPVAVMAEPPRPSRSMTLPQAIAAALRDNPDLAGSVFEWRAAEPRIRQAGLSPNPEVELALENFGTRSAEPERDKFETTLTLGQVLELGGKRRGRLDVARADQAVRAVELEGAQLDVLAEVTRRFIAVVAAQEEVLLQRETLKVAEHTLEVITTRVRAARSSDAERRRASIAAKRLRLDLAEAERSLAGSRRMLAAMWGSAEPGFDEARAELFELEEPEPYETLRERVERNPDLLRFASEARLKDAELRLAQATAVPDINVHIGVRRVEGLGSYPLVAGVALPLPLFNRNQGEIAEARLRREQSDVQRRSAQIRIEATLYGLHGELLQARARVLALRADLIPEAQAAVEQTQAVYDRGRFSYLELADALRELIELRRSAIEAAAEYHRLRAEIERLSGEPLNPS